LGTAAENVFACATAFCPMVHRARAAFVGRIRTSLLDDAHDLFQLVHQLSLVCRRPAVSMMTTSASRCARRRLRRTRRRPHRHPASLQRTPRRSLGPQSQLIDGTSSETCHRRDDDPLLLGAKFAASFPMNVVLPAPFTPMTRMIIGLSAGTNNVGSL
jgi:hypothetical protein